MQRDDVITVGGVSLPPTDLLFMNSDPESGLKQGTQLIELVDKLVSVGTGLFLDIGCGWGRAAYGLLANNFSGDYVGFDLLPNHIRWLQDNFSTKQPRYRFFPVHVFNGLAQSVTGNKAADIGSILNDRAIYTAAAFSVFTHVFEETLLDVLAADTRAS